jgi:hypothetical protein
MSSSGAFGNGDRAGFDEDDYTADDDALMKMFTRRDDALSDTALRAGAERRAIREREIHIQQQKNCAHCTNTKHLVIASGSVVALSLKTGPGVLSVGHCELHPIDHISSVLQLDDDGHAELARFKSCLVRYFETQQQSVLFLHGAVGLAHRPHAVIDVVPIGSVEDAKMFFREALLSADDEWTQHKRVIELTVERPLRHAVPAKFPYVAIEWGTDGADGARTGLAHVVENEALVTPDFSRDVIAGMLNQDPMRLRRRRKGDSGDVAKETAAAKRFQQQFAPHDWTQYV